MPKSYTSRELVKLVAECGGGDWPADEERGDHHNFKNSESRFIRLVYQAVAAK